MRLLQAEGLPESSRRLSEARAIPPVSIGEEKHLGEVPEKESEMGSTFYSLHYHLVFSTKERRPYIKSSWRSELHQYLGGTIRGLSGVAEMVGGVEDHVHLLLSLKTVVSLAELARELKKASSFWAAEQHDPLFSW